MNRRCYKKYKEIKIDTKKWYEYLDKVEDDKLQKIQDEKFLLTEFMQKKTKRLI